MKNNYYYLMLIVILIFLVGCSNKVKKEYEQVKKLNSVRVYEKFIDDNYSSVYADSAQILIQKIKISNASTISDLESFLKEFPKGKYSEQARVKLAQLKKEKEEKENELKRRRNNPCYGIELVKFWTTGSYGGGMVYVHARIRNNTSQSKYVTLQVMNNRGKWIDFYTKVKVYANDVKDAEIEHLSNFGNKVRIVSCE